MRSIEWKIGPALEVEFALEVERWSAGKFEFEIRAGKIITSLNLMTGYKFNRTHSSPNQSASQSAV